MQGLGSVGWEAEPCLVATTCYGWVQAHDVGLARQSCLYQLGLLQVMSEGIHTRCLAEDGRMLQIPNPEFEGQTKTRLGNPEVRKLVDTNVAAVSTSPVSFPLPASC